VKLRKTVVEQVELVSGTISGVFLVAASNPSGGQLEMSVNNQTSQVVDLSAPSESCGSVGLTGASNSQSELEVPFEFFIENDGGATGEMFITAKILKAPAQVDGAK
jgi:hypothetical protein